MKTSNFGLRFTDKWIYSGDQRYDRQLVDRIIQKASDPFIRHAVVDGFAGMGGVTGGFEKVPGYIVIACINHWDKAIQTHAKNHPDCLHLHEDFRTADIAILRYMVQEIRRNNPGIKIHLWLSLECTNFSNAKGGMSRDADSRTLADHAYRYVYSFDPDTIWIENVKEFLLWGPMVPKVTIIKNGKKKTIQFNPGIDDATSFFAGHINQGEYPYCPLLVNKKKKTVSEWLIPEERTKGQDYKTWKEFMCILGYEAEERLLNCADYGVPQHRVRLIIQFNRPGEKVHWPAATHSKKGINGLPKWKAVKPCLDLSDEGESVLAFKTQKGKLVPRISSPATIERLIRGIDKHVIKKSETQWIYKQNSASNNTNVNNGSSISEPCPTITAFQGQRLANVHLVDHYFGNGYMKDVTEPVNTTGTTEGVALYTVKLLGTYHSQGDGSDINSVSPSIMTKDKYPVISTTFLSQAYSGDDNSKNISIDNPSRALTGTGGKLAQVTVEQFLVDTQYENGPVELSQSCKTITANGKYFYLVSFQWFNQGGLRSIHAPSPTLIARQDKAPTYLVTLETGELAIEVFENDPPHYRRLKQYMAEHGIVAINMRMLKEVEMLRIMTIPETTKMSSSSTANKKMIGNAVPTDLVVHLAMAYDQRGSEEGLKVA